MIYGIKITSFTLLLRLWILWFCQIFDAWILFPVFLSHFVFDKMRDWVIDSPSSTIPHRRNNFHLSIENQNRISEHGKNDRKTARVRGILLLHPIWFIRFYKMLAQEFRWRWTGWKSESQTKHSVPRHTQYEQRKQVNNGWFIKFNGRFTWVYLTTNVEFRSTIIFSLFFFVYSLLVRFFCVVLFEFGQQRVCLGEVEKKNSQRFMLQINCPQMRKKCIENFDGIGLTVRHVMNGNIKLLSHGKCWHRWLSLFNPWKIADDKIKRRQLKTNQIKMNFSLNSSQSCLFERYTKAPRINQIFLDILKISLDS